jgi:signal transduction histidine kinase
MLERACYPLAADQGKSFGDAISLVQDLIGRIRSMSMNLRPTLLDDLGLLPALRWQTKQYTERTGVQVTMDLVGLEGAERLPLEVETAAYRIVQEALTNASRHTQVRAVSVHMLRDGGMLRLRVEDKGPGFSPENISGSNGISGMRERATRLGGTLVVHSRPGDGTQITASLPISG